MAKGYKTGGRVKGSQNKDKFGARAKLAAMNCDPIEGMAIIAKRAMEEGELPLAGQMYKELAQYVEPKKRAVEVTGEGGGAIQIRWADD